MEIIIVCFLMLAGSQRVLATPTGVHDGHSYDRVIAKSGLMAYGLVALWPCGLQSFFVSTFAIVQNHHTGLLLG